MNLVLLRVSMVTCRADDRHVSEEKRTQLSSTPSVTTHLARLFFQNVAADVYAARKKRGFHNRTRRTMHIDFAVVCVSLCLCRMLRNSVPPMF